MMAQIEKSRKRLVSQFIYLSNHWFSSFQIQTAYLIDLHQNHQKVVLHQRFFLSNKFD